MKIIKICEYCNITFNADNREIKRGNAKYCSLSCASRSKEILQLYNHKCKHCGEQFYASSKEAKYCSNSCKQKNYRLRSKVEGNGIKSLYKLLQPLPCQVCGWKEATRDIHHIIPVSKGGKNIIENLITLCPNHHRMVHQGLISQQELHAFLKSWTISSSISFDMEQDA